MTERVPLHFLPIACASLLLIGSVQEPVPPLEPRDTDLILGTWTLDPESSSYDPGPMPKSQTRLYEATLEGVKTVVETVDAEGRESKAEYTADYDSVEYPITGSPNIDAISLRRINARVAEARLTHGRTEIGRARRVISEDGDTLTINYTGTDPSGRTVKIVAVYRREQ